MANNNKFRAGFIAVVGRPNVGKSTLINELIGQKLTITSSKPQTTRHRINAICTTDEYQMVLVDTPGVHIGKNRALNAYMNKTTTNALVGVDVVLWLVEVDKYTREDAKVLEYLANNSNIICCINKIDKLKDKQDILVKISELSNKTKINNIIPISAFSKKDVEYLKRQILGHLPAQNIIFEGNYITDRSERFLVAEFIREKLVRYLKKELPYGVTVDIEYFKFAQQRYNIAAKILVERSSQKSIVIGDKGLMLKKIGSDARKNIEGLLGAKVFLKLWVKTKKNWSDNKQGLQSLGYD